MTRYDEYKNSGEDWLGKIPSSWKIIPIGYLSSVKRGASPRPIDSAKYFDVEGEYAWTRIADVTASDVYLTNSPQRLSALGSSLSVKLEPGELFLSIAATVGKPCITAIKACIHDGFVYFPNLQIPMKFLYYVFAAGQAYKGLGKMGTQLNLNTETVGRIKIGVGTLEEQKQIAKFLDYETEKIDALIEKQQQLIALLKEKRQAVISHAVTKGLNPDAPMRDSGVEWLGEVPAHWITCSLGKRTINKCDGPFGSGLKSEHYTDAGVRVIRLQNIKMNIYRRGTDVFIDPLHYERNLSDHSVVPNDVLIAGLGDPNNPVGRACVAPEGIEPAMVKADCFRFRLDRARLDPEFMALQLSASAFFAAGKMSNGSTRARIPMNFMAKRMIAYCPLNEQKAIVSRVRRKDAKLGELEVMAVDTVELLQERRTALISAAVTGKIDVREWKHPEEKEKENR